LAIYCYDPTMSPVEREGQPTSGGEAGSNDPKRKEPEVKELPQRAPEGGYSPALGTAAQADRNKSQASPDILGGRTAEGAYDTTVTSRFVDPSLLRKKPLSPIEVARREREAREAKDREPREERLAAEGEERQKVLSQIATDMRALVTVVLVDVKMLMEQQAREETLRMAEEHQMRSVLLTQVAIGLDQVICKNDSKSTRN
jgi:hypothetical protein